MKYKGYQILATDAASRFYTFDENEIILERVLGVQYDSGSDDIWYSVVNDGNWVEETFSTVEECKEYIDEETE